MTSFKVAHIKQQGQDMVIIPLHPTFGRKSQTDQNGVMDALRLAARVAGLAGSVATIWADGSRIGFIAPSLWHPFFKSPDVYSLVMANINRELTISS